MKYFLKGDWEKEYTKVTREQYITAEREAGFFPKNDEDIATDSFDGHGVSGEVKYVDENGDEAGYVLVTTYSSGNEII